MKKTVYGKYCKDDNFTTVFCDNKMYVISNNTGKSNYVKIGQQMNNGFTLSKELFDKWKNECTQEGMFKIL